MAGSSFSISFNGRKFALPEDADLSVTLGGLVNKAGLRNGDGTVDAQKTRVPGKIMGITPRVRNANGDFEALQRLSGLSGVSCEYRGPDGNYTGTGIIVAGDEGLKMSQSTDTVEAFEFICANGFQLKRR